MSEATEDKRHWRWPVVPKAATLKKYGLTLSDWSDLVARQDSSCFVCRKLPASGRLCVDHFHARGWKKMPATQRREHVRGLLCGYCNLRLLHNGMTLEKARRVVQYLQAFEARHAANSDKDG